jgi:hypothetical protein
VDISIAADEERSSSYIFHLIPIAFATAEQHASVLYRALEYYARGEPSVDDALRLRQVGTTQLVLVVCPAARLMWAEAMTKMGEHPSPGRAGQRAVAVHRQPAQEIAAGRARPATPDDRVLPGSV